MRNAVAEGSIPVRPQVPAIAPAAPEALAAAAKLLAGARKPVLVVGLQCKDWPVAQAARALAKKLACPVFSTYKAKGVLPDADPQLSGYYISGAAEEETLRAADLVVMLGADPVEFPPQAFKYASTPVLEVTALAFARGYFTPAVSAVGELTHALAALEKSAARSAWTGSELAGAKARMLKAAEAKEGGPISPQLLVEMTCAAMPKGSRVTVDAGVHMLTAIGFCKAERPLDLFISRGLASMATALPCAIGAAAADPSRHVVALTGDGGLLMCVAELATAVKLGCRLTVVVFNDAAITMIGLKQRSRKLAAQGMDYSPADFAKVAEGFGCRGYRATDEAELKAALDAAFTSGGVSVVDAVINPASYYGQLRALRG
jgi:acetolactate synthase-1/2/3 large subunit